MTTTTMNVRSAENSQWLDRGVRLGLVVYGTVHLIIAFTALQLAFGSSSGKANQQGALSQLAQSPLGDAGLVLVAVGLAAMVVWQLLEAAVGYRVEDGAKRAFKRLACAAKAVVYGLLSYSAASMAVGSGSSGGSSTDSMTAQLMSAPAGQLLVGAVGSGIVAVGAYLAYKGWAEKFTKHLDAGASQGSRRKPIVLLGKVGYLGKGAALAAVGVLFVVAAVRHQAKKSGGLDVALQQLLQEPFGPVLVAAVAVALACFGLYCFAWARHLVR
jgi:hypothetical protein